MYLTVFIIWSVQSLLPFLLYRMGVLLSIFLILYFVRDLSTVSTYYREIFDNIILLCQITFFLLQMCNKLLVKWWKWIKIFRNYVFFSSVISKKRNFSCRMIMHLLSISIQTQHLHSDSGDITTMFLVIITYKHSTVKLTDFTERKSKRRK